MCPGGVVLTCRNGLGKQECIKKGSARVQPEGMWGNHDVPRNDGRGQLECNQRVCGNERLKHQCSEVAMTC